MNPSMAGKMRTENVPLGEKKPSRGLPQYRAPERDTPSITVKEKSWPDSLALINTER